MAAPEEIKQLIERFRDNLEDYKSGKYKETQVRREFIDPMFNALGWDVANRSGYAEAYKDVVHEDAVKVGGYTKAPDYCFRVGGTRKFFLEAKKPSVHIKNDIHPAYQLRRYAWSAKLPLSILTDFEEFAVYDCRMKPNQGDNAAKARVMYLTFEDYEEQWDELYSRFSRDAILKGAFDKYVQDNKTKRGTAEVDDAFLEEIERWRERLAKSIAKNNPSLSVRDLNFAVQRTIDRIIFLRICEDRGIEKYGHLQGLQNGKNIYARLLGSFRDADVKYNSGLFHFRTEKGRAGEPDQFTPNLNIPDAALKNIFKHLYYPDSPYEFSVLPADILGQVYEQFLGHVIGLTPSGRARVEQKPEVKKAGGVYYTPTYIVDYIVENTVGKLLEPRKVVGISRSDTPRLDRSLRVLDPACGSGSFLIGAYQHLLDWYRDYYTQNEPKKWAKKPRPPIYQTNQAEWLLTLDERKRILLDHVFGVDIDAQAVEVTKLSLLLKVLEGQSLDQLQLFAERVLPDLGDNIKCGNSLIGPDFYANQQMDLVNEEAIYRINAFDWSAEFPQIFETTKGSQNTDKEKGFDAVIGNPPYIRIQGLREFAPQEADFYKYKYRAATKGNYDIYVVFLERGLRLLNTSGLLGYILPHKFFNAQYGEPVRSVIAETKSLHHVVHFGHQQVFPKATTYTCLCFLTGAGADRCDYRSVTDIAQWRANNLAYEQASIPAARVTSDEWNFVAGPGAELFQRMNDSYTALGELAHIFVGVQTSADDVFIVEYAGDDRYFSKALECEVTLEPDLLRPLISGTHVNGYEPIATDQRILFPYRIDNDKAQLIPLDEISERWPGIHKYLINNKTRLEDREKGRLKGKGWHGFIYLKNMAKQGLPKLCVPRLVSDLHVGRDAAGDFVLDNVDVCGIRIKEPGVYINETYLFGLLNSRLLRWYFPYISAPFRGGWRSANRQFLSQLPIQRSSDAGSKSAASARELEALVSSKHQLNGKLTTQSSPHGKKALQRQAVAVDRQIDQLVYELYQLTEEEIAIVEEATA